MAKVILVQTYLEIPTRPSRKLQLWILASGSELTLSYYYKTLTLNNLRFYSLHWLEFFHQDHHHQFFPSKMRSLFKIKCCMFNPSFLYRLDGKYRNPSAPLVEIFSSFRVSLYLVISVIGTRLGSFLLASSSPPPPPPHACELFSYWLKLTRTLVKPLRRLHCGCVNRVNLALGTSNAYVFRFTGGIKIEDEISFEFDILKMNYLEIQ